MNREVGGWVGWVEGRKAVRHGWVGGVLPAWREGGTGWPCARAVACWGLRRHQMTVFRPTIIVLIRSLPARRLSPISTLWVGRWVGG